MRLYEVKAFVEDFHSWFIDQTVQRGENAQSDDALILVHGACCVAAYYILLYIPYGTQERNWADTRKNGASDIGE